MGRPIKKSLIGSGSGKIQVTSYRLTGGVETSGDGAAYIVSQRSTRRFKVSVVDESDSSTIELDIDRVWRSPRLQGAVSCRAS